LIHRISLDRFPKSHTARWLQCLWLGSLLILLVAGVWLAWFEWTQVRNQEVANLQTLAASVAEGTQVSLDDFHRTLELLAQEWEKHPGMPIKERSALLQKYEILEPNLSAIGTRLADGRILAVGNSRLFLASLLSSMEGSRDSHKVQYTADQRKALQQCVSSPDFCIGPPVLDSFSSPKESGWVIPLFQPTNVPGKPLIAILPLIHGELPIWRSIPIGPDGSIFLLRDDGFLEARFPPPTKIDFAVIQNGIAARFIRSHPQWNTGAFSGFASAVDQWRLGVFHRIQGYPLAAGVGVRESILRNLWWRNIRPAAFGWLLLLLITTLGYRHLYQLDRKREKERQEAANDLWEAKERAEVTLYSIGDAVITTDTEGHISNMNPVAETLVGCSRSEAVGKSIDAVFHLLREDTAEPVENPVWRVLREGTMTEMSDQMVLLAPDGMKRAVEDSAAPIRDRDGKMLGVVLVCRDVSEKRRMLAALSQQATHDPLTGLANRSLFMDRMEQDRARALRQERLLGVGLLDLDGFKLINDRYGHAAGDTLLQEMAQRLSTEIRVGDTVARMGGDEFGILLPDIQQVEEIEEIAQRLLDVLQSTFLIEGEEIRLSGSLGLTMYPLDEGQPEDLLRHADLALYAAKAAGRNCFRWFDQAMENTLQESVRMQAMTESALRLGQLKLYYQPVIQISQRLVSLEALIRLDHPERGLLPPAAFASALDSPRLTRRIGCFVLDAALTQLQEWHQRGMAIRVSVNISAYHLLDPGFLTDLETALARHQGLPPGSLGIEVTETAPLLDFDRAKNTLKACNEIGVRVALDDFGTGNASLTYLQKLPTQTIKIDQTFVRDIITDPRDYAIVSGVITSARLLGLEVIAEGVETAEHVALLKKLYCDYLQGYAIAKPMAAEAIPEWVSKYHGGL